jgi:hypothetical protein
MGKAAEKRHLDLSPRRLKPVARQVDENERQQLSGEGLRSQALPHHTHMQNLIKRNLSKSSLKSKFKIRKG